MECVRGENVHSTMYCFVEVMRIDVANSLDGTHFHDKKINDTFNNLLRHFCSCFSDDDYSYLYLGHISCQMSLDADNNDLKKKENFDDHSCFCFFFVDFDFFFDTSQNDVMRNLRIFIKSFNVFLTYFCCVFVCYRTVSEASLYANSLFESVLHMAIDGQSYYINCLDP